MAVEVIFTEICNRSANDKSQRSQPVPVSRTNGGLSYSLLADEEWIRDAKVRPSRSGPIGGGTSMYAHGLLSCRMFKVRLKPLKKSFMGE